MRKKEKTASFTAIDEQGNVVTIVEHTTFTLHNSSGVDQWLKGSREFSTSSGKPINHLDGDRYQDVMTNTILTRRR